MKNQKLYLVGYKGKEQTARYSNDAWAHYDVISGKGEIRGGVSLMTLWQAKRIQKKMPSGGAIIYKVVATKL